MYITFLNVLYRNQIAEIHSLHIIRWILFDQSEQQYVLLDGRGERDGIYICRIDELDMQNCFRSPCPESGLLAEFISVNEPDKTQQEGFKSHN